MSESARPSLPSSPSRHLLKIFDVLHAAKSTQGAMVTVPPGQRQEVPANPRRWAEQYIYVVAGSGNLHIGGAKRRLRPGSMLRVGKHEPHVLSTGDHTMIVVNIYVPPKEPMSQPQPADLATERRAA